MTHMPNSKIGKVWLVGAGPGDPGLLTCRGHEVLSEAEVVVFDRLVGDGILALMPQNAKCINVGKEGGHHPIPQWKIEEILVKEALEGHSVVRLKGGDPFMFGRGGEEIEALLAHNIPYEVVPGVTSAIAAPAYAGIPVTHRGLANSLHIITGHTKEGNISPQDYDALAKTGGTLVFLMGVSMVGEICEQLQKRGYPPTSPMAAVEWGTTAKSRAVLSTVADFPTAAKEASLHSPAVLIVGEVANLSGKFSWREALPLWNKKVIITRPRKRQGRLSKMLRVLGAEVVELPCIETVPLETKLPPLGNYAWLGFTSATGVECFFASLAKEGRDIREIGGAKIAAIGAATAKTLSKRGLKTDLVPQVYDGIHLAHELAKAAGDSPILMLRARDGSPELTQALKELNANFLELPLYKTEAILQHFHPRDIDAVMFTSASTVRSFKAAFPDLEVPMACCIGVQTAREAERLGFKNIKVAKKATLNDLISTLLE